jgi:hypothetical protein
VKRIAPTTCRVAAHGTDVNALRFDHRVEYEIRRGERVGPVRELLT